MVPRGRRKTVRRSLPGRRFEPRGFSCGLKGDNPKGMSYGVGVFLPKQLRIQFSEHRLEPLDRFIRGGFADHGHLVGTREFGQVE